MIANRRLGLVIKLLENSQHAVTRYIVQAAMIAALYAGLTLAFAPISFSFIQLRIAEAFTILPVFTPVAIPGLTIGCMLANLFGVISSTNPLGFLDVFIGSGATLLSAILTYILRRLRIHSVPWASFLAPVFCNGLIVGTELYAAKIFPSTISYGMSLFWIALPEFIVICALGVPLYLFIKKSPLLLRLLYGNKAPLL